MNRTKKFLTVKAAAAFLGVAPNTIRNWDRDGKIPVYRHPINKYRLFKESDLQSLLRRLEGSRADAGGRRRHRKRQKPK